MVATNKLDRFKQIRHDQVLEYSTWKSHHEELSRFILPRRSQFNISQTNQGGKRHDDIIDPVATFAVRTLASGMTTGITSPSRPWFRITMQNEALNDFLSVRSWLHEVAQRMRDQMLASNLYTVLPNVYEDVGCFGTSAFLLMDDDDDVFRAYHFPIGSYQLSTNFRREVDCMSREFRMTVRQIVDEWGYENASVNTKTLYDDERMDDWIDVVHMVCPNQDYDLTGYTKLTMPFVSVYYESAADQEDGFLDQQGYREFPVMAPRWRTNGESVYGDSPGMDVLGDVKALQFLQIEKAKAFEKQVDPPMQGPPSLRGKKTSIVAGDVTFVDATTDRGGFRPSHEVRFDVMGTLEDIREHESRIDRAFYVDLFLSMLTTDRRNMTATEVDAKQEEKLLMLGPVLERLNDELLEPMINRVFNMMDRRGMFPPPPQEIRGQELKIEYVSILATAQKLVGVQSLEKLFFFTGQVAQLDQQVLDKLKFDKGIDEMHEMLAADPDVLRTDDEVQAIRTNRAKQQAAAAQMEQAAAAATIAKDLGAAPVGDSNALEEIVTGGQVPG